MEISVTYVTIVIAHTIRLIKIEYKQRIYTHTHTHTTFCIGQIVIIRLSGNFIQNVVWGK